MSKSSSVRDPAWLVALYFLAATVVAVVIGLLRSGPWTRGSAAALILAWAFSVGLFRVAGLLLLKRPVKKASGPAKGELIERPVRLIGQYLVLIALMGTLALVWR
jgi:hypothetical protein